MNINGWAYEPNEDELAKNVRKRYEEVKHLESLIQIESVSHGYASTTYRGTCPEGITEEDLAIILDRGNLCFGGHCEIRNGHFVCTIYED